MMKKRQETPRKEIAEKDECQANEILPLTEKVDEASPKGQDFIEFQSHCAWRIWVDKEFKGQEMNSIMYIAFVEGHKGYCLGH